MTNAFQIRNLSKKYPDFQLGPLNIDLEPGRVLGFVGPNGSGKTTTMQCMVGLLKPDEGEVEIFGRRNDPSKTDWKFDIGYVGDSNVFYEGWSVEKNIKFISKFYPNWSHIFSSELITRLQLPVKKKVRELSTGNRVKLALVCALSHQPKLLIFDEPTSGLDPIVRTDLLDLLFEMTEDEERSIFYSTHILTDISRLADELLFINNGQILQRSDKEDLTEKWRQISFKFGSQFYDFKSAVDVRREADDYRIVSYDTGETIKHLHKLGAENIEESRLTIDQIAVHILKGASDA
jgi:ABC-2 type transport system ATP-binding protein